MKKLFLGVDGGGTKTDLVLADKSGEISKKITAGPASLRNNGLDKSCENVLKGFKRLLPIEGQLVSTFVGFPALGEEYWDQKEYIEEYLKKEIPGKLEVGSDQLVAFKSGTDKNCGLVVIAGTGGVVKGFNGENSQKASGWGYFADEGSAFWVGLEAYRRITKELDGRGEKTLITEMIFEDWNLKDGNELNRKIYSDPMNSIPKLSIMVDYAQREGDKIATQILEKAADEIFEGVEVVSKKLKLDQFPLILVGGMFKSGFLKKKLDEKVKKEGKKINIIKPEKEPVFGAVKLAISNYEEK